MHPIPDLPLVPGPFVWRLASDLVLLPRTPALLDAYHQLTPRDLVHALTAASWAPRDELSLRAPRTP